MTSTHQSPPVPLPEPLPPAAAAQALADAAGAAALAWARPVTQDRHHRAVAQLYAALLDLGIAARGLAAWQLPGTPDGAASPEFARLVNAGAFRFREAHFLLDDVVASGGTGPLPYPDEPGAALCRAARGLIPAWRRPGGSTDYRDTTVRALLTATGLVTAGALGLAAYAPRRTFTGLQSVVASLAEAVAALSAAIGEPAADPAPDDSTSRPLPGSRWPGAGEAS